MQFLTLAEHSAFQLEVVDARGAEAWATCAGWREAPKPQGIVLHHSMMELRAGTIAGQYALLKMVRNERRTGLPCHFYVFPGTHKRVWYLNDVDQDWGTVISDPGWVHIALWGDFEREAPGRGLVARVRRLCEALNHTYERALAVVAHRDVEPCACPGQAAFDALLNAGLLEK